MSCCLWRSYFGCLRQKNAGRDNCLASLEISHKTVQIDPALQPQRAQECPKAEQPSTSDHSIGFSYFKPWKPLFGCMIDINIINRESNNQNYCRFQPSLNHSEHFLNFNENLLKQKIIEIIGDIFVSSAEFRFVGEARPVIIHK